ncbi:MAG: hypothetical protein PHS59_06500 [Paludibacter sp.]|nr:hypothetical protein [Paludibacter sp.]
MKLKLTLLLLIVCVLGVFAQNSNKTDSHNGGQNILIKVEGSQNNWIKNDPDGSAVSNAQSTENENVVFTTTSEGIYISNVSGTNKIKLYALTGQLLLSGDLAQGRFFIPARKGIYFLRINNKSFKVVCK